MLKGIIKFLGALIFVTALILVTGKLFFEKDFDKYSKLVLEKIWKEGASVNRLRVAYSGDIISYEPTVIEANSRGFLMNVYESLLRPNRFMELKPQLAISWGVLDDELTWEFKLRKNVKFHDGSNFEANDVISSIDRALNFPGSQLKTILSNVDKFEKKDDYTVLIKTKEKDPLLPSKISSVLIFPAEKDQFVKESSIIGTASYKFLNRSDNEINLIENTDYWGALPRFKEVSFLILADKFARLDAIRNQSVDIVLNVPPDNTEDIEKYDFELKIRPGLEASFLLFNFKNENLADKNFRKSLNYSLDKSLFQDFASQFVTPLNQYAPDGILGYNPDLQEFGYRLNEADKNLRSSNYAGKEIALGIASRMEILGNYLRDSFSAIGVKSKVEIMNEDEILQNIQVGKGDIYFIGWRFSYGDIADFLGEVVHTRTEDGKWGKLNFSSYSNQKVDELIEESFYQIDTRERGKILREVMRIIVEEDMIGIPLFSSKIISANLKHIDWEPRTDAYFLASEVK